MTSMDYFRRPVLAGKALKHLNAGFLRGSKRRLDPDGFSAVPYFSGVSTGQTLNLDLDGTPYPVALTGATPNYQSILNDINTALGVNGEATDEDGAIGIKTFTPSGYLSVTGGTAAAALGFDVTKQPFRSAAGDLYGTPERRVSNPYGAAFPVRGENLTVDTLNRALGRLSSNLDVLFSEHMRQDGRMAKIPAGSTTVSSPAAGTSIITLPSAARVFTGKSILPATPTAEALAPFVQLIDPVTGLPPATCRVIDIVRGTVVGSPPYSDAPNYAGAGSVVNVDLVKYSGTITGISNGRVVEVIGATFLSNGTQVGDWANITGAANVTPWSNNGYRWVVEEILDNTHVALRPMSKSEAAQAGITGNTEEQPIVDLNGEATGVFGTLEIHTGTYTDGVKLVVQPAIPAGATYDVWIKQPLSVREANSGSGAEFPAIADVISQKDPLPNGIISGFIPSGGNTATASFTEGYIRMHGKILRVPTFSYSAVTLGAGTHYVYFDESDARVKTSLTTLPAASRVSYKPNGAGNPVIHPIAVLLSNGTTFSGTNSERCICRYATSTLERVTVGEGGDFPSLLTAARYINGLAQAYSETSNDLTAYPHFEVVVISDISVEDVDFYCPSLSIRGANPQIKIQCSTTPFITVHNCYFLRVSDLIIDGASGDFWIADAQDVASEGAEVYFSRVRHPVTGQAETLVSGTSGGRIKKIVIEDCDLNIWSAVSAADPTASFQQDISVVRSTLNYIGDGSTTPMFKSGLASTWVGSSIRLRDSYFSGWYTTDLAGNIIVDDAGTSVNNIIDVDGCKFAFGSFPLNSNALLISSGYATTYFCGNVFTNTIPRCIYNLARSEVSGNILRVAPHDVVAGTAAITAERVLFNYIYPTAPSSNVRGTVIAARRTAIGNRIVGEGIFGIDLVSETGTPLSLCSVDGNYISLSTGTQTGVRCHAIRSRGTSNRITNNTASMSTTGGYALDASTIGVEDYGTLILGNNIGSSGCYGIQANTASASGVISDNELRNTTDSGVAGATAIKLRNRWLVEGNLVFGTGLTGYVGLRTSAAGADLNIKGNYFDTPDSFDLLNAPTSLSIEGCHLVGSLGAGSVTSALIRGNKVGGAFACPVQGDVSGNIFDGSTIISSRATNQLLQITGNRFNGTLSVTEDDGRVRFVGNSILSSWGVTKTAGGVGHTSFVGNDIKGALTATASGSESAIDQLEDNRLELSGTPTLYKSLVSGNTFVSTTGLTLRESVFGNNRINSSSLSFIGCSISNNIWSSVAPGTISIAGDCVSSGNWYNASSWSVSDNFWSSNEVYPSSFTGVGFAVAALYLSNVFLDAFTCVSGANYNFDNVQCSSINVAAANCLLSNCDVGGNITSTTWDTFGRLRIDGCKVAGNISIAPSSPAIKTGSQAFISDTSFNNATIVGVDKLSLEHVRSGASGTVAASYFGTWETRDSTIYEISSGGGTVMRVYDSSILYPNSMSATSELTVRGCVDMDEVVVPGSTGNCFISECYASKITVSPNAARVVCLIEDNYTGAISAAGQKVSVRNNTCYGKIYIEYPDGAKNVSVTGNIAKSVRSATPNSYAIHVRGTTSTDALDLLDLSDNELELDNIGGSSDEIALGIHIGATPTPNFVIRHLKMNGNIIRATRVPSSVSYAVDSHPNAVKVDAIVHSGIVSGNEIVVPRPGSVYTGGGFIRWRFFLGLEALAASTNVIFAGNHFAKSTWTHASPPVWTDNVEVGNTYNDGSGSVSATGTNDIYNGGFHKCKNTTAFVEIPDTDLT